MSTQSAENAGFTTFCANLVGLSDYLSNFVRVILFFSQPKLGILTCFVFVQPNPTEYTKRKEMKRIPCLSVRNSGCTLI